MIEVWTYLEPHIWQIIVGIATVVAILCGKYKPQEVIAANKAKKAEKAEKRANKAVEKAKAAVAHAEELKKE